MKCHISLHLTSLLLIQILPITLSLLLYPNVCISLFSLTIVSFPVADHEIQVLPSRGLRLVLSNIEPTVTAMYEAQIDMGYDACILLIFCVLVLCVLYLYMVSPTSKHWVIMALYCSGWIYGVDTQWIKYIVLKCAITDDCILRMTNVIDILL